jgi:hypothetical protein
MTRTARVVTILLVTLVSCTSHESNPVASEGKGAVVQGPPYEERVHEYSIEGAIGVVVLTDHYSKSDFVNIYNEDGSLWYRFTFYGTETNNLSNTTFKPLSFNRDYFLLVLKCMGKSEGRFEVVVDEETGLRKYARADDPVLKLQTWEEHILQTFAVDYNRQDNPVLDRPNGSVKGLDVSKEVMFHPVEINGEWLKVRWSVPGKLGTNNVNNNSGWIRWKKGRNISIELIYFS